jgi:hypothetical protein
MPDVSWSKAPGRLALPRRAVVTCNGAWNNNPKQSKTAVGKPKGEGVNVPAASWHEANMLTW